MPAPRPAPPPEYRYGDAEAEIRRAVQEVAEKTKNSGLQALAHDIRMPYKDLIRHLKRSEEKLPNGKVTRRSFLSIEDLGRIAAWVGEKLGEPMPPGWPIQTVAAYRRLLQTVRDAARPASSVAHEGPERQPR